MRRVRFLTHVMGAPGPVACFFEGEVAWVSDDVLVELAWHRDRKGLPWLIEISDDAEAFPCRACDREFAPSALRDHFTFYHRNADAIWCRHCGRDDFKTVAGRDKHVAARHPKTILAAV